MNLKYFKSIVRGDGEKEKNIKKEKSILIITDRIRITCTNGEIDYTLHA